MQFVEVPAYCCASSCDSNAEISFTRKMNKNTACGFPVFF